MTTQVQYSKVTPFIRPISIQGGTFFTFSSAGEDFTLSFNENNTKKFKFSKFALLKIPELSTSSDRKDENLLRLTAIPGAYKQIKDRGASSVNLNTNFAESFQNYCLNLETLLLSRDEYNESDPKTVSERAFFKWLKETGAMRYVPTTDNSSWNTRLWTEEPQSTTYKRVVQYIGDIDVTNSHNGAVNSSQEVYVTIPTEAGNFPQVYFKSVFDDNYFPGMSLCRMDNGDIYDPDNSFIAGRKYNDYHPIANFDTHAYYDSPFPLTGGSDAITNSIQLRKSSLSKPTKLSDFDNGSWWYDPTPNFYCYHLQPTIFTDASNDFLAIGDPTTVVDDGLETYTVFKRSRLDGIEIEFDAGAYVGLDVNINDLNDVAKSVASQSFEFNAVLFYYDLYERDEILTVNPTQLLPNEVIDGGSDEYVDTLLSTNLFGVLFLDNINTSLNENLELNSVFTSLGTGLIPSLEKCIPNRETKLNGNSYGIKLNIKLDISAVNSGVQVESVISNNATFSLEVFVDALNQMRDTSNLIVQFYDYFRGFDQRMRTLEEVSSTSTANSFAALSEKLAGIEDTISNSDILLSSADKKELVGLINENYEILNNLLKNNTNLKVAFDLGGMTSGPGIIIDRKENGVTVRSNESHFNFSNRYIIYPPDIADKPFERWIRKYRNLNGVNISYYEYESELKSLNNYIRIKNDGASFKPDGDFYLKIKDSNNSWKTGQTLRLYFENAYEMSTSQSNYDFYIKTDFHNQKKATTNYTATIAKITANDFKNSGNKPVIEIHCIDAGTFEFIVDFLN